MAKIYLKKEYNKLIPADEESLEHIKKLSKDEVYRVEIVKQRNYQYHKKFFALIKLGHENTSLQVPMDVYRKIMIVRAGFFTAYATGKGTYFEPDSISFSNMSQEKFEDVYSRVLDQIVKDLDTTSEEIENQIRSFF